MLRQPIHSLSLFIHPVVSDSLQPHELQHARLPCPSPYPGIYPNSCLLSQWCHSTISSSVTPFSCPQSFPESESSPMSQLFTSGVQSIGASALSSVQSTHSSSFSKLHPCIKSTYQGPAHLVIALATWWVKNGSLFLAISAIKQWSQFPTPLHLSYPSNLVWPVEYGASTTVKLPRLDLGMSTYLKMSAAFPSLLEWFSWPPAAVFWEPKHPSWQPSWAPSWQPAPSAAKWGSHVGCSPQPSSWMMQPQQMWVSLPSWTQ